MSLTHLPAVPFPKLDALFRIGETLWGKRPDVREAHGELTSWDYWCWMMFSGTVEYGELQSAHYPFPEPHLTQRVTGATPLAEFLRDGVVDAMRIHRCLEEAGFDFSKPSRWLDFGCGCGRLLRVMARHADTIELHGADVDDDAVGFCANSYDFATFAPLPQIPPSGYPAGHFDVIYAYSVFTHLSEARTAQWIAELARISAPGALLVLTTAGRRLVEHFLAGRPEPVPTQEDLKASLPELEEKGFLFFPFEALTYEDNRNTDFFAEWNLMEYGMTFILESYVRKHWLESFELVALHRAPENWQDYVVLRRSP